MLSPEYGIRVNNVAGRPAPEALARSLALSSERCSALAEQLQAKQRLLEKAASLMEEEVSGLLGRAMTL